MAHEGFRLIAAPNTADLEGNALPAFIRSRLHPLIQFGYPSRDEIDEIVKGQCLDHQEQISGLLSTFWEEWGKLRVSRPPSPRDAISVFSLASNYSSYESIFSKRGIDGSIIDFLAKPPEMNAIVEPKHVAQAMKDLVADFTGV